MGSGTFQDLVTAGCSDAGTIVAIGAGVCVALMSLPFRENVIDHAIGLGNADASANRITS